MMAHLNHHHNQEFHHSAMNVEYIYLRIGIGTAFQYHTDLELMMLKINKCETLQAIFNDMTPLI